MGRLIFNDLQCTGCRACELACSFEKTGRFWPARSRVRVVRLEWEGIDFPLGCHQCDPPHCIVACPTRALSLDTDTEAVLHDPALCIGCQQCVVVCPHQAIHFDPIKLELYKCDTCEGEPRCIQWCETEALTWEEGTGEVEVKEEAEVTPPANSKEAIKAGSSDGVEAVDAPSNDRADPEEAA